MNYPLISEYIEAIRSAEDNFDKLTNLRPVLDDNGNPIMSSGNFAVVFKMEDVETGKLYAVKCFTKEQMGRSESYKQIAEELEFVQSTYLAKINYYEKELFVDTNSTNENEFPVLLMDWVNGLTMGNYIRQNIHDKYALELLAYNFSRMAMWLLPQPFAHGDLKPDNIMVRPDGSLTLVDYDGMYVPSMQGEKSYELGSPDFRHPLRTENDFNERIDDFSAISILLSLRLIAYEPSFFNSHESDRLLFCEKDYRELSSCAILKSIFPSQNIEIDTLVSIFTIVYTHKELMNIPINLLQIDKPKKSDINAFSTKVSKEDLKNAVNDTFGVKYSKDGKRLVRGTNLTKYEIKEGTVVICEQAFRHCKSLQTITIPNSLKYIGAHAFAGCNINHLTIPESVEFIGKNAFVGSNSVTRSWGGIRDIFNKSPFFIVLNKCLFSKDYKKLIYYWGDASVLRLPIDTIDFSGVYFLNPPKILEVSDKCGENVYKHAHIGARILKVYSVKNILINTPGDTLITSSNVYFDKYNAIYSEDKKFLYRYSNYIKSNGIYKVLDKCERIDSWAFEYDVDVCGDSEGCVVNLVGNDIKELILPKTLKEIGDFALAGCNKIKSLTIPSNVIKIGDYAFSHCEELERIYFEGKVLSLSEKCMDQNPKERYIKNPSKDCIIVVPKSLKSYYERYFRNIIISE